jgi:diaminopimelate decarboxylase
MLKVNATKQDLHLQAAAQHGTPLYLYDDATLSASWQELRNTIPTTVDIFYSLKANPNLAISHKLCQLGAHAETCSPLELKTALRAGFKAENIIFLGPAKSKEAIKLCLENNIYAIVCESLQELALISQIAEEMQKTARIALRINPDFVTKDAALKMGGKPSQFGIDQTELLRDEKYFLNLPAIEIIGLHVYNGTRILKAQTIIENTKAILELANMLSQRWHKNWQMLDVGGGFGVPYFATEKALNLSFLKKELEAIFTPYQQTNSKTRLIVESGRFLVANCGCLLTKIIAIKNSKGETFIVTDGGTNCFMAASNNGTFLQRNFPISLIKHNQTIKKHMPSNILNEKRFSGLAPIDPSSLEFPLGGEEKATGVYKDIHDCCERGSQQRVKLKCDGYKNKKTYNITGPLCTPNDLLGKRIVLSAPEIGDFILVHCAGAYGLTASPDLFLSHGYPAEVLMKNDTAYLIRQRFNEENLFATQFMI